MPQHREDLIIRRCWLSICTAEQGVSWAAMLAILSTTEVKYMAQNMLLDRRIYNDKVFTAEEANLHRKLRSFCFSV